MESIKIYNIASVRGFVSMRNNANTKLLIHAGEADTTAGTNIIDSSASGHTITASGNAQVDTAQAKFGTGSVLFDGTGDYLTVPDHADFALSTGAFTIDFWVRVGTLASQHGIFEQYIDEANRSLCVITTAGKLVFQVHNAANHELESSAIGSVVADTWTHFIIARTATVGFMRYFQDGVWLQDVAVDATDAWPDFAADLDIGRSRVPQVGAAQVYLTGHIDEFRWVKGECMVPTTAYPVAWSPPIGPYA